MKISSIEVELFKEYENSLNFSIINNENIT